MAHNRGVPVAALRRIVSLATRAPSVHNTQPWRLQAVPSGLELHADRARRLPATDPDGRNLVISCGVLLHHLQVVGAALGWAAEVTRFPRRGEPDLVAEIQLRSALPVDARETVDVVSRRCTDRRRFTSWPVPDERLNALAQEAERWGTMARPLFDVTERFRAERLILRAADEQAARSEARAEQERWLDRGALDGIPRVVLEEVGPGAGAYRTRFDAVPDPEHVGQDLQVADGVVLIFDAEDVPRTWLGAGEGLSAMWLAATHGGLSLVPLSQVVEEERTREAFRAEVLHNLGHPLILTRVGWQAIGRSELTRTPRRPVSEVLHLSTRGRAVRESGPPG